MAGKSRDWKTLVDAIRKILYTEWDPIGCGVPEDEYDSYIGAIYGLLQSRTDVTKLADHLEELETNSMGLTANPQNNRRVAEMLLRVMK
jgi:hypothetical protein